jgi:hypothetical protein
MPTEAPGQVWKGYLWAEASAFLSIVFPNVVWEDHAIESLSVEVCGQIFRVVKPVADKLLFGQPEMEDNLSADGNASIVLLPCDEYSIPHILHYVGKVYGEDQPCMFRTIEYKRLDAEHKSLQADYRRMCEIDDEKTAALLEARSERDTARGTISRYRSIYTPLTILYVFLSLITIAVMAIALSK